MNFLIFIILVAGASFYFSGQIKTNNDPLLANFVTWSTTLIALNLLIALFIYMFSHSVKNATGNQGVRGLRGRRGSEGKPDFCNFGC